MAPQSDFQKALFESISSRLPPHISLVDEISEVLNVSADSAYRRIRGDKVLSLNEAEKLSHHFNVSLDNLMGIASDSVTFKSLHLNEETLSFADYLKTVLSEMQRVTNNKSAELIFQLNELNLFHANQFPEILAFKIYFWSKSSLDFKSFRDKKFSLQVIDDEIFEISSLITGYYVKCNTLELFTQEFLISFLKQIEYYWLSGFFEKSDDAVLLCDKASELIEHLRKQAELGYKFAYGSEPSGQEGNLKLYSNNLTLTDNVIIVNMGHQGMTYLTNGAINLLFTTNQDFFRRNLGMIQTIIRKSTLISGGAERERNYFFNTILDNINQVKKRLTS